MVDPEIKTDTTQEKAETTSAGTSPQAQEAGRKLLSVATLKELSTRSKNFGKEVFSSPHGKELIKTELKQALLACLCFAEIFPGIEVVNDVTKALSIVQKTAKEGKKMGVFAELYKNVPKGLKTALTGLDLAGVPAVGVVPELWQMTVNQGHIWKSGLLYGTDIIKSGWRNFVKPLPATPVHA